MYCPSCGKAMDEAKFKTDGILLTFTTLWSPPEGFAPPVGIGLVELEGGARVLCQIDPEKEYGVGDAVTLEYRDDKLWL